MERSADRGIDRKFIGALRDKYPWFDAARRASDDRENAPVHIALTYNFRLGIMPGFADPGEAVVVGSGRFNRKCMNPDDEIIDKFLMHGDYRIVASDDTPDMFPGQEKEYEGDEFMTEEMARIYLAQGDRHRAVKIYERLSLLYPEKSVYFAEIIERTAIQFASGE